jgi:hypothetical protein
MPTDDRPPLDRFKPVKFHLWSGKDTAKEERRAENKKQALSRIIRNFQERREQFPPRPLPADTPVPNDLCTIPQAAKLARVNVRTLYRLIDLGLLRRWGSPHMYRISISELMPETSPVTDRVMTCSVCGKIRVGRPGKITGWKALQLSAFSYLYFCTAHFPAQYVEEQRLHSKVRNQALEDYQKEVLFCWVEALAVVVRRIAEDERERNTDVERD